jgi:hypothetical protein
MNNLGACRLMVQNHRIREWSRPKSEARKALFSPVVQGVKLQVNVGIFVFCILLSFNFFRIRLSLDAFSKPRREVYYRSIGPNLFRPRVVAWLLLTVA